MAATPQGFRMQTPDHKTSIVDMQPKGRDIDFVPVKLGGPSECKTI